MDIGSCFFLQSWHEDNSMKSIRNAVIKQKSNDHKAIAWVLLMVFICLQMLSWCFKAIKKMYSENMSVEAVQMKTNKTQHIYCKEFRSTLGNINQTESNERDDNIESKIRKRRLSFITEEPNAHCNEVFIQYLLWRWMLFNSKASVKKKTLQ